MRITFSLLTLLLLSLGCKAQSLQEWRDSISKLNREIDLYPSNVTLRMKKAAINIELGQWAYALDEYTNVLELEPHNLTALYYRGYVNQHLKRYNFARNDYQNVLAIEPQHKHALMGLVLTNIADGHITSAYNDANRLVEANENDAEALALRADVERQLGMTAAAIDDIEQAISIETEVMKAKYPTEVDDNITAYQLTAFDLYMTQGNTRRAKLCLDALTDNGLPKAYLAQYYAKLREKRK